MWQDPCNDLYQESFEEAAKAIESHQQAMASGASTSSYASLLQGLKSRKSRTLQKALMYQICGWVILAASIVGLVGFAKTK
ncbi:mitochondrial import receptor subunit TOM20-like [Lactuca sativa]|uniref:mitochondrial import receptor subunit TOM20-like n=1 Tax=Lactuca sativa TaxID=4236 RepID=UPI000CD83DB7|nr:mitochondrial import receptor subunit TOM20-like [Lactuca sativa]